MNLVIPMSGLGARFARAGYTDPKPLINIHGRPIIEWVLKMFPGAENVVFICRNEHLETTEMRAVLERICPTGRIIGIEGHKLGPVYAVSKAYDAIADKEPVLVSYCDYYMHWDYEAFIQGIKKSGCHGAVPCYSGFHPHLIPPKNLYASCRVDEKGTLLEIREKYSFTEDKTLSRHSPGLYYFATGELLKKYFTRMIAEDISLGGEYYISLVYNLMVADGLKVDVPVNVERFCQWGTPEDLREYEVMVDIVRGLV